MMMMMMLMLIVRNSQIHVAEAIQVQAEDWN
jgi:hypothetical protein